MSAFNWSKDSLSSFSLGQSCKLTSAGAKSYIESLFCLMHDRKSTQSSVLNTLTLIFTDINLIARTQYTFYNGQKSR